MGNLIKDIEKITAVLLYGSDISIMNDIAGKISKDAAVYESEFSDITNLRVMLSNKNFLNEREVIKIHNTTDKLSEQLKSDLSKIYYNKAIFFAPKIKTTSKIKKFFDSQSNLLAIACYQVKNIRAEIQKLAENEGVKITPDAMNALCSMEYQNFDIVKREIEKLIVMCCGKKEISLEDVNAAFTKHNSSLDITKLLSGLLLQNADSYFTEVEKVPKADYILIVRNLLYQVGVLRRLRAHLSENKHASNMDISRNLGLFYKSVDSFIVIVKKTPSSKLDKLFFRLYELEKKIKSNAGLNNYLEMLYFI